MEGIDLNLLRVFDVIYRTRNVSRAAEILGMSQPSTSQALSRLRLAMRDPLFERTRSGVRPTSRAQDVAASVQAGLAQIESVLASAQEFDPAHSSAQLRIHLTDIGEAHLLPMLMRDLCRTAPGMRLYAESLPQESIGAALESGDIHLAVGYFPDLSTAMRTALLTDRYVVLLRSGHPAVRQKKRAALSWGEVQSLDWVAVHSHAQPLRILQLVQLDSRVVLSNANFLVLPAILRNTDLAALMPESIARKFTISGGCVMVNADLPLTDYTVSVHWSRRHAHLPLVRWARDRLVRLSQGNWSRASAGATGQS